LLVLVLALSSHSSGRGLGPRRSSWGPGAALGAKLGAPADIVSKIEPDVIDVLKDPALVDRLQKVGAEVSGMPATRLRAHIQRETEELKKIANEANIRVE